MTDKHLGNIRVRSAQSRNLTNGRLARSKAFELAERDSATGVEYEALTLTLYKVRDGSSRTYPLDEGQF
ncbi:hypothetical protein [Thiohalocapsa sp. ML1]|jgi:hypothetical protein|uniref:hypothetical protein n=1 Tax=Thiohalocapsa sp. ML1 TaxID=1431688 RepID=UPI0007323BEE|nr:hypothetical protein [Thiohalocapsa sp. ML1]